MLITSFPALSRYRIHLSHWLLTLGLMFSGGIVFAQEMDTDSAESSEASTPVPEPHGEFTNRVMGPLDRAYSAFGEDPYRQFDFWIGVWDVRLQARGEDLQWGDLTRASTHIYSILGGRAIVELWDSKPIKGYSLRYWDAAAGHWVLWLNWPGNNRSSNGSLTGNFEFGRGNFQSEFENAEGQRVMQRYSFNDITPFSLRWDDFYSLDGGQSGRPNWKMHFYRTAVDPEWPINPNSTPTFTDGDRCDLDLFRALDAYAGDWQGERKVGEISQPATAQGVRVLDGCALFFFIDANADGSNDYFVFRTWDTAAEHFEDQWLAKPRDANLVRYFSQDGQRYSDLAPASQVSLPADAAEGGAKEDNNPGESLVETNAKVELNWVWRFNADELRLDFEQRRNAETHHIEQYRFERVTPDQ